MKQCCKQMQDNFRYQQSLIEYESESRSYSFLLHESKEICSHQDMCFCPWCGKKLPKDLSKEWCQIVKEKFGYNNVFAEEWTKLPQEFKTDKWWRKRGL